MKIKSLLLVVAVLATAILCVDGAVRAQTVQPTITSLSASTVTPGSSVTIYGTNLLNANTVILYLSTNQNNSTTINASAANQDGTSETFVVPQSLATGNYEIAVFIPGSPTTSNEFPITISTTACVPNWQCVLSPCTNGSQSQVATDTNNCGYATGRIACSAIAQACGSSLPQPTITYLSVSTASLGGSVTIYGTNLLYANTVTLYVANHNTGININAAVANNDGTDETFVVPQSVAPGNYEVAVWAQGSQVSSNELPLTITSTPIQPTITITSPVGGENWNIGETHNITWISNGLPNDNGKNNIGIDLINDSGIDYLIGISNSSTGLYSWTISSSSIMSANNATLLSGTYKIKIYYSLTPTISASAISNYITVATPTTTPTNSATPALIAQLQAEIQSLLQQIAQLQGQQGTAPAWCYTFNTNLGVGSSGNDVTNLITALQQSGFPTMHAGTGLTDTYGEDTAALVVQFQSKYGITPQSGYVGIKTRAELNSLYGCSK